MKQLTLFENQAAYDAAKYGLDYPNVSVLTASPNTPLYVNEAPTPSHEYVEIGGVKWATMNVGATGITDYGLYFQWGDTQGYTAEQCGSGEGQKYFGWEDYKYCEMVPYTGSGSGGGEVLVPSMTKYNESDGKTVLESSDDAVAFNWGDGWRMPTKDEYVALYHATTSAWTTNYKGSGVSGLVLTDISDSSKVLFFPAQGRCYNGSIYKVGGDGHYWHSSLTSDVMYGYTMWFYSDSVYALNGGDRCNGVSVRGVLGENSSN